MKRKTSLKIIILLALAGVLFSGYLSYSEIVKQTCGLGDTCSAVFTIPACVYGFFMYLLVLIFSWIGFKAKN